MMSTKTPAEKIATLLHNIGDREQPFKPVDVTEELTKDLQVWLFYFGEDSEDPLIRSYAKRASIGKLHSGCYRYVANYLWQTLSTKRLCVPPDGTYLVDLGSKSYLAKVKTFPIDSRIHAGDTVLDISEVSGNDVLEQRFQRVGTITCGKINGSRYLEIGQAILKAFEDGDPYEMSKEFGRKFGTCGVCGRLLSDPESVARGIGPECYRSHREAVRERRKLA